MLGFAISSSTAAAQTGVLGQWRFDEGAGQVAVDDGPHGLNGVLGTTDGLDAADPARIAGASGGALHFEGGMFVRLPDSAALAPRTFTIEATVRAAGSPGAWRYLISRGGTKCIAGSYGLYTGVAGGVALYVFDGTRYVVSATARPEDVWNGAWHDVAASFDGRALRLFVDGRAVGEPMEAPLQIDYATTSSLTSFGQYAGDCELGFRGDLDLVRLRSGGGGGGSPGFSLVPAAPGGFLDGPSGEAPRKTSRGCVLRVVTARTTSGKTRVRVRVTRRARALRAAHVIASPAGRKRVLASARTNRKGRATLAFRFRRPDRVRVAVRGRADCKPVRTGLPAPSATPAERPKR